MTSFAMGAASAQAGGGSGGGDYQEGYSDGYANGYIDGDAASQERILNEQNADHVIYLDATYGYTPTEQTSLTVTANDTYDTTLNNSVTVAVPDRRPVTTVTASTVDDLKDGVWTIIGAMEDADVNVLFGTFTATLSLGGQTMNDTIPVAIYTTESSLFCSGGGYDGSDLSFTIGIVITASSAVCNQLYLIQNGSVTDLTANAGSIISDIALGLVSLA